MKTTTTKNENYISAGLLNSFWQSIKPRQLAVREGFCQHLQSEPSASDPRDLGNGSVFKAASRHVKEHVCFSCWQTPIVKENDNFIKLVFCPANCTNVMTKNERTLCNWDSCPSGPDGAQGTPVPQRQTHLTFVALAHRAGLSERSVQPACLICCGYAGLERKVLKLIHLR